MIRLSPKRFLPWLTAFLLLAGCASDPGPSWIAHTNQLLQQYRQLALTDQPELAQQRLQTAEALLRKAGDIPGYLRLVAHRNAVHIAVGQKPPPPPPDLLQWAAPSTRAVLAFLRNPTTAPPPTDLPKDYQRLAQQLSAKTSTPQLIKTLRNMEDPFRRLVCARLALQHNPPEPGSIRQIAIDTASRWAWQTPLLQLLEDEATYLRQHNQPRQADRIQQQIDFIRANP